MGADDFHYNLSPRGHQECLGNKKGDVHMTTSIEVRQNDPSELIVIKQLPVIEEHLQAISWEIQAQRDEALALEANEENLALIRAKRAELNKTFNDLEARRIAVKKAILAPYDAFEEIYKRHITDIHKPTDEQLKKKIDSVDKILIDAKTEELQEYFQEVAAEKGIDFVPFYSLGLKINRSANLNKLKTQIHEELDRVAGDLAVISTMEHSAEILVEYKQNRNLAQSVATVKTRKERLAKELERQREAEQRRKESEASQHDAQQPRFAPPPPVFDPPHESVSFALVHDGPVQAATIIKITAYTEANVMAIIDLCKALGLAYTTEVVYTRGAGGQGGN